MSNLKAVNGDSHMDRVMPGPTDEDGGACEGCEGSGVRVPADPSCELDVPNGWCVVERCDHCELYGSDESAALAVSEHVRVLRCEAGGKHVIARVFP